LRRPAAFSGVSIVGESPGSQRITLGGRGSTLTIILISLIF
jgi:hypothetical protein